MDKIFYLLLALSIVISVQGFLWSSQLLQTSKSSKTQVAMAKGSLQRVKDKYTGRADIFFTDEEEVALEEAFRVAEIGAAQPPTVGQTITGTILEVDDVGAWVSIGGKMSAFLPLKEVSLDDEKNMKGRFESGQVVTAEVIGTLKGTPVLSLRASQLLSAWEKVFEIKEKDATFDVTILEVNKGGAVVNVFGLKGFLPGSHFMGIPDERLIGTSVSVKLLEVIEDEGKVVVSQRRVANDNKVDVKKGQVVTGTVTGLRSYGIFVELEGGDAGLLHVSQISCERVDNMETLFTIGQPIKVMILEFDKATGKVALSTKALEVNPGDMLRNMQSVFDNAESTAKVFMERLEAERLAREAAAKDIVAGLGNVLNNGENEDQITSVAESIESILQSIVAVDTK